MAETGATGNSAKNVDHWARRGGMEREVLTTSRGQRGRTPAPGGQGQMGFSGKDSCSLAPCELQRMWGQDNQLLWQERHRLHLSRPLGWLSIDRLFWVEGAYHQSFLLSRHPSWPGELSSWTLGSGTHLPRASEGRSVHTTAYVLEMRSFIVFFLILIFFEHMDFVNYKVPFAISIVHVFWPFGKAMNCILSKGLFVCLFCFVFYPLLEVLKCFCEFVMGWQWTGCLLNCGPWSRV